ncbi:phage integrase central domain-containing protein [Streptomyces mirabilis]|uniref:phage integrase central domain-containing protein n=1 Tax=Streptomyces mirabilis TaxID=68239 RepID=UPI0036CE84C9
MYSPLKDHLPLGSLKTVKVKSDRYGTGLRYRALYIGPDGTEKSKSFRDREKRLAEKWLTNIEADMSRGQYVDPRTARTTFRQYAERWVKTHTGEINSREAAERRLRLHAYPHIGTRPLGSFKPEHIRDWIAALEDAVPAESHRRIIVGTVSAALSAAVDDGLLSKNPCRARTVQLPKPGKPRVTPWTADQTFGVRAALERRTKRARQSAAPSWSLLVGRCRPSAVVVGHPRTAPQAPVVPMGSGTVVVGHGGRRAVHCGGVVGDPVVVRLQPPRLLDQATVDVLRTAVPSAQEHEEQDQYRCHQQTKEHAELDHRRFPRASVWRSRITSSLRGA